MKRMFLSTLILAGLASACATAPPHPHCTPAAPEFRNFEPGYTERMDDPIAAATKMSPSDGISTAIPANAEKQVHYDFIPGWSGGQYGGARAPERRNCEVRIRDAKTWNLVPYRCDEIKLVGGDLQVKFYGPNGPDVLNFSDFRGGFIEGDASWEQSAAGKLYIPGTRIPYFKGHRQRIKIEMVWSTHQSTTRTVCRR